MNFRGYGNFLWHSWLVDLQKVHQLESMEEAVHLLERKYRGRSPRRRNLVDVLQILNRGTPLQLRWEVNKR